MTGYLIKRLLGAVVVMWAVATLVFFMLRILPGDPLAAMLFDVGDPAAADELRVKFGLDQPMIVQYWRWFTLMLQGDLGSSIYGSRIPVSQILMEAAPRTLSLALLAFFVAVIIAIPAGLVSALRKGRPLDHGVTFIAFLGLSMPDFWLGILLIILFAANLGWLPAIGYTPLSEGFWPWLSHLILPAIAAGTAFHTSHIGARAWFGHRQRIHPFAAHRWHQIALDLLTLAGHQDVLGPPEEMVERHAGAAKLTLDQRELQMAQPGTADAFGKVAGIEP